MDKFYRYFLLHSESFIEEAMQNIYDDLGEKDVDYVNNHIKYSELIKLIEEFNSNVELLFTLNDSDYNIVRARFNDISTALAQVKLMREGKLERKNIHEFLKEL